MKPDLHSHLTPLVVAFRSLSIVALLTTILLPCLLNAQSVSWQPTNGPFGGNVNTVISNASGEILAGTDAGIFISDKDVASWDLQGLPGRKVSVLLGGTDERLYAGTDQGLFVSTNGGYEWLLLGLDSHEVRDVLLHPNNTVFVITGGNDNISGLYRSTDAGETWQKLIVDPDNYVIHSPRLLTAGPENTVYLTGEQELVRSDDNGDTWCMIYAVPVVSGISPSDHIYFPLIDAILSTHSGDSVLTADNFGVSTYSACASQPKEGESIPIAGVCTFYRDPNDAENGILAGRRYGDVFRSTDEGATWEEYTQVPGRVNSIASVDGGELVVGTDIRAVFRSKEGRSQWEASAEGIARLNVTSLMGGARNVAFAGTSTGMFKTTNRGASWEMSGFNSGPVSVLVKARNGSIYAASGESGWLTQYNVDGDREASWVIAPSEGVLSVLPLEDRIVVSLLGERKNYGSSWDPFWVQNPPYIVGSTDGGQTWDTVAKNLPLKQMTQLRDGSLLAEYKGLVRSTDYGETWNHLTGAPDTVVRTLHVLPDGSIYAQFGTSVLQRSDDNGETWAEVTDRFEWPITSLLMNTSGALYLLSRDSIHQSNDRGTTWAFVGGDLPDGFRALGIDDEGYLYAGGRYNYVYRSTGSTVSVEEDLPAHSGGSAICDGTPIYARPVAPNPLVGSAKGHLSYSLCNRLGPVRVRVELYNVRGELMQVLFDGVQPGVDNYLLRFNIDEMASGPYYFRIAVPGESELVPFMRLR